MATITGRVIGNLRGKMGDTVYCRWRNLYVAKKPSTRKKKKGVPSSPQVENLVLMSKFLRCFTEEIQKGFQKTKSKQSTWSLALKYNLEKAIFNDGEMTAIDYKNVRIADGNLEGAWAAKIYFDPNRTVRITWQMSSMAEHTSAEKDNAWVVIYNCTEKYRIILKIKAVRKDQTCTYHLPQNLTGDICYAWIFFISPDGRRVSTSDYIGGGVLIA